MPLDVSKAIIGELVLLKEQHEKMQELEERAFLGRKSGMEVHDVCVNYRAAVEIADKQDAIVTACAALLDRLAETERNLLGQPSAAAVAAEKDGEPPAGGVLAEKEKEKEAEEEGLPAEAVDAPAAEEADVAEEETPAAAVEEEEEEEVVAEAPSRKRPREEDAPSGRGGKGAPAAEVMEVEEEEEEVEEAEPVVISSGDLVVSREEKDSDWILCRVMTKKSGGGYTVRDEDDDTKEFDADDEDVLALPSTDELVFGKGARILALYPGTTTFYQATVVSTQTGRRKGYTVLFNGDGNKTMAVPPETARALPE